MERNDVDMGDVILHHNGNGYGNKHKVSPYELKSEEMQDIISKMPHWIIRRGIAVLFMLMVLLFAGAYFIHYPDVVSTQVSITSGDPPVKLVAPGNGKIRHIFVQNNGMVKKDETICVLANPAEYEDVLVLKNVLTELNAAQTSPGTMTAVSLSHLRLGELQPAYADLCQAVNRYSFFLEKNFTAQKLAQLQSQVGYQSQLKRELQRRDILLQQQLALEKKRLLADSSLVRDKVIAPLEYDNSKKELINKQLNADAAKTSMIQHELQQAEYSKTITDLRQQTLQQQNDLQELVLDQVKRLLGQLEVWEQRYLVKTPVAGKAVFFKVWKEHQYVTEGEAVIMIVPPVQHYVARALLPVNGAGKVKAGQKVLIKLASYPFEEFGIVRGRVQSVSMVAMDDAYAMEIQLVNGLKTSLHKHIPEQPQLTGIAEVLTSDKNILDRLFERIWRSE